MCENDDLNSMLLFAETIETDCYSFDRVVNGVPVFAFGKSVDTESDRLSSAVFVVLGGRRRSEPMTCCSGRNNASPSVHTERELSASACRRYR
jgi:hypothetical protein